MKAMDWIYLMGMGLALAFGCDDSHSSKNEHVHLDQKILDQNQTMADLAVDLDQNLGLDQKILDQQVTFSDQAVIDQQVDDQAILPMDMQLAVDQALTTWDEPFPTEVYAQRPAPQSRLYAGVAEKQLGFPLGSGAVGYGPKLGLQTPFTSLYSGTDIQHTQLTSKAVVLRQDQSTIALVRLDTIGVWQDLTIDLQNQLRAMGRGDLADGLVLAGTHTHASGGRVFKHLIGEIAVGEFSPEFYTRLRSSILASILEADQNAQPAKIGHHTILVSNLHRDRRCEDGEYQDDHLGLIKITQDDGTLMAVLLNYAMHGTIIGNESGILSSDAPGAVEQGVENALAQYVPVLYFQSWAGDMSPSVPTEAIAGTGDDLRDEYTSLEAISHAAAQQIIPALDGIELHDQVDLKVKTIRFVLNNELINPDGSFDRYPYGGLFCFPSSANDNCGPDARVFTPDNINCIRNTQNNKISWAQITALKIGSLGLITLPGEPLTDIATELRDRAIEDMGVQNVWVMGYAQGHFAYLVHKDDYFLGGYESTGTIWGPGLGLFFVERGLEIAHKLTHPDAELSFSVVAIPEIYECMDTEFDFEESLDLAQWSTQPMISINDQQVKGLVQATFIGGDPAIDAPLVWLEKETSLDQVSVWQPYTHQSNLVWKSEDGYLTLSLSPDPPYSEAMKLDARRYYWHVYMPIQRKVRPANGQLPSGRYRFVAKGKQPTEYQIESNSFDIP
jgi:hypothetical protein